MNKELGRIPDSTDSSTLLRGYTLAWAAQHELHVVHCSLKSWCQPEQICLLVKQEKELQLASSTGSLGAQFADMKSSPGDRTLLYKPT